MQIRNQVAHDAVGIHDRVRGAGDAAWNVRHGLPEHTRTRAHPNRARCAGRQEARSVRLAGQVFLVADGLEVIVGGGTVTRLAVGRADAVAKLRDLECHPVKLRQRGDQARHHAGLPHTARMPANDYERHICIFAVPPGFRKAEERAKHLLLAMWGVPVILSGWPTTSLIGYAERRGVEAEAVSGRPSPAPAILREAQ